MEMTIYLRFIKRWLFSKTFKLAIFLMDPKKMVFVSIKRFKIKVDRIVMVNNSFDIFTYKLGLQKYTNVY